MCAGPKRAPGRYETPASKGIPTTATWALSTSSIRGSWAKVGGPANEVIHSVIEPGGNGGEELYALTSEVECAYVLSGTIEVVLQHGPETLSSGDAMTFPGSSPHTWRNPGPETCVVLWILAPAP